MRKLKSIFAVFLIMLLSINIALALSPLLPIECSLEGTIKSVEFAEADCIGTPGQMICWKDEYRLELEVEKVSTINNEFTSESCEEAYPLNSLQDVSIPKEKVNDADIFEVNSKISGLTSRAFGTQFISYNLEAVEEPPESTNNNLLLILGIAVLLIIVFIIVFILMKKKR